MFGCQCRLSEPGATFAKEPAIVVAVEAGRDGAYRRDVMTWLYTGSLPGGEAGSQYEPTLNWCWVCIGGNEGTSGWMFLSIETRFKKVQIPAHEDVLSV